MVTLVIHVVLKHTLWKSSLLASVTSRVTFRHDSLLCFGKRQRGVLWCGSLHARCVIHAWSRGFKQSFQTIVGLLADCVRAERLGVRQKVTKSEKTGVELLQEGNHAEVQHASDGQDDHTLNHLSVTKRYFVLGQKYVFWHINGYFNVTVNNTARWHSG